MKPASEGCWGRTGRAEHQSVTGEKTQTRRNLPGTAGPRAWGSAPPPQSRGQEARGQEGGRDTPSQEVEDVGESDEDTAMNAAKLGADEKGEASSTAEMHGIERRGHFHLERTWARGPGRAPLV